MGIFLSSSLKKKQIMAKTTIQYEHSSKDIHWTIAKGSDHLKHFQFGTNSDSFIKAAAKANLTNHQVYIILQELGINIYQHHVSALSRKSGVNLI